MTKLSTLWRADKIVASGGSSRNCAPIAVFLSTVRAEVPLLLTGLSALFNAGREQFLTQRSSIMPKDTKAAKPAAADAKKGEKKRERKKTNPNTPITREATINLHKRIHGVYASHLIEHREACALSSL